MRTWYNKGTLAVVIITLSFLFGHITGVILARPDEPNPRLYLLGYKVDEPVLTELGAHIAKLQSQRGFATIFHLGFPVPDLMKDKISGYPVIYIPSEVAGEVAFIRGYNQYLKGNPQKQ